MLLTTSLHLKNEGCSIIIFVVYLPCGILYRTFFKEGFIYVQERALLFSARSYKTGKALDITKTQVVKF